MTEEVGRSLGGMDSRLRGNDEDGRDARASGRSAIQRPDPAAPEPGIHSITFDFLQDSIAKRPISRNAGTAGTTATAAPMRRRALPRGART